MRRDAQLPGLESELRFENMKPHPSHWWLILISFLFPVFVSAQVWVPTSAPTNNWQSIACSADGTRVVAVAGGFSSAGPIVISTNSGASWFQSAGAPSKNWTSVASSADGTKLAAVIYGGGIYTSTNSGNTWKSNSVPVSNWRCIAASGDGSKLMAVNYPSGLYNLYWSSNSGDSWIPTNAPTGNPYKIAAASAGNRWMIASDVGPVLVSTNFGGTWTTNGGVPSQRWESVVVSADGLTLLAGANLYNAGNGVLYASTNLGGSWRSNSLPSQSWVSLAVSADGSKLCANTSFNLFTSTNAGKTWASNNIYGNANVSDRSGACVSADGSVMLASSFSGVIWRRLSQSKPVLGIVRAAAAQKISWTVPSTNFVMQQSSDLQNWTDATNAPTLNLTNMQNEIVLPSAGGNYFYRLKTP